MIREFIGKGWNSLLSILSQRTQRICTEISEKLNKHAHEAAIEWRNILFYIRSFYSPLYFQILSILTNLSVISVQCLCVLCEKIDNKLLHPSPVSSLLLRHCGFVFNFLHVPFFLLILLMLCSFQSPSQVSTLYKSTDPHSLSKQLAFAELYSYTPEGKQALRRTWELLNQPSHSRVETLGFITNSPTFIQALIGLVNKNPSNEFPVLNEKDIEIIESMSSRLHHKNLKGHLVKHENEVLLLPSDDVDLARGLLLSQMESDPKNLGQLRSYEAFMDLMALQIQALLPAHATDEDKLEAINRLVFEEMEFRFPPHSAYSDDIDLYTFLPSVLDSRRGVCLGVSILYLCLAQRIGLSLEIVTPPGHIYVRYRKKEGVRNIETTARGIHVDSDVYLGINTKDLQTRALKDVIGLAHFNQASVYWKTEDYAKALVSYQKAALYLPDDMLLKELSAYTHFMLGHEKEGQELLKQIAHVPSPYALFKEPLIQELLEGKVSAEGLRAVFMHVDETRSSLLQKKDVLEKVVKAQPEFRTALFHLAGTLLQLHQNSQAIKLLEQYQKSYPEDPTANYYLTVLSAERLDFQKAWAYLQQTEKVLNAQNHNPKALKDLRKQISIRFPEPTN